MYFVISSKTGKLFISFCSDKSGIECISQNSDDIQHTGPMFSGNTATFGIAGAIWGYCWVEFSVVHCQPPGFVCFFQEPDSQIHGNRRETILYCRGRQTFSVKAEIVNILGFTCQVKKLRLLCRN